MTGQEYKKERHIAFITDDNYVMPTHIVICSISENLGKDANNIYVIHICTFGLNETNRKLLDSLHLENIRIIRHDFSPAIYAEKFSQIDQSTHVTPAALIKFDLPDIFTDIDELLYLDSDIIVQKSIGSLFEYDISEQYMAASFEFWRYLHEVYTFNKFSLPEFYFNSGVMLLNLKKMREDGIPKKLWQAKLGHFNDLEKKEKMMDQDAFNAVCAGNCLHLPIKYNCNCYFTKGIDIAQVNSIYGTNYRSCKELKEDSVIIHYVGKADKPWKYVQGNCVSEWEYYYEKAGYSLDALDRKQYGIGLSYRIGRFLHSIRERGFIATIKYIAYRKKTGGL